jgi:signal peptidase I
MKNLVIIFCLFLSSCTTRITVDSFSMQPGEIRVLPGASGIGNSMLPAIQPGETITIQRVPYESLKIGDIVLYRDFWSGYVICHRLISAPIFPLRFGWEVKGDNNPAPDVGLVTKNNYIAKVIL